MVAEVPQFGSGAAITFASGFLARITSLTWDGVRREHVGTTNFDTTGGKTFKPAKTYDPGALTVEMQFKSDDAPPITSSQETVTITWGDAETMSASGSLSDYSIRAPSVDDDLISATAVVKFSGDVTW